MGKRKNYSPEFKAKVVIEAIKGDKTVSQIASEFGIHPVLVTKWKKQFLENFQKILSMNHLNTLNRTFCVEAAEEAVRKYGYPEIIHSDKGKQFLSKDFMRVFKDENGNELSKMSFGEKGHKDNIYIERFWRTHKYECLYLREIDSLKELKEVSREWVEYYNRERLHQFLGYKTPDEVYYGQGELTIDGRIVVWK